MPRPRLTGKRTTSEASRELGMDSKKFLRWLKRGVLPQPSFIDNNGVRYFDQVWLQDAKKILRIKGGSTP